MYIALILAACEELQVPIRIISPHSTPSLALRGEIRNKVTSYSVHYVVAVLQ